MHISDSVFTEQTIKFIDFDITNQLHVKFMYDVRTSREVAKNLFGNPPVNLEQHTEWLNAQNGKRNIFLIKKESTSGISYIGYCHIYNIRDSSVEVGWALHPKFHNMGFGKISVDLLIQRCNIIYGKDIELYVRNNNIPALVIYIKSGFIIDSIKEDIVHMKRKAF